MEPGTTISHYEILSAIGKGGMGEVWKARDTKLGREVAIKTLPREFSQNADRLARFEREARLLATLNHPNIGAIYGLENSEGSRFLVLELVEGETLADRLQRGAIDLDESLKLALQIADALEAAHEKGVIHRDLKPANIKVTPDGRVKVLDFGLAKAFSSDDVEVSLSNSPTILTTQATQHGLILGTAGYMSPEQARGNNVDKRTDIWSFGVVLYEMVTGKRLFGGATVSDTLAAVLMKQPDLNEAAPRVRKLLAACLERDPKRRLRDIGEAWRLLEEDSTDAQPVESRRSFLPWIAAAALALTTVVAAWAPWRSEPEKPMMRLDKDLLGDGLPSPFRIANIVISPDGTRLLYITGDSEARGRRGGPRTAPMFIRRLDQPKAQLAKLDGTEGARGAAFSSDSKSIAFSNERGVSRVSVEGGPVIPVSNVVGSQGVLWADDGTIFASGSKGLWRISPHGEATIVRVEGDPGGLGIEQVLPDGKTLLAVRLRNPGARRGTADENNPAIETISLADGTRKFIADGVSPRYLPTGHLIFVRLDTLFAVQFDLRTQTTHGDPMPIVDDVLANFSRNVTVSRSGTLAYVKGRRSAPVVPSSVVDSINIAGNRSVLIVKPGGYSRLRFSQDGNQLAIQIREADSGHESVYDLKTQQFTQVTFGSSGTTKVWTPGGHLIIGTALSRILWTTNESAEPPRVLVEFNQLEQLVFPTSFSHGWLAFTRSFEGRMQIFTVRVSETGDQLTAVGTQEPLFRSDSPILHAEISPDGHLIAYSSNKSGRDEVYVRAFPPPASSPPKESTISNGGGRNPHWWKDQILYVSGDNILSTSYLLKGNDIERGKTQVRVPNFGESDTADDWDVAPNGNIAVLRRIEMPAPTALPSPSVVFFLNLFDQLRRQQ